MYCSTCGVAVPDTLSYCNHCGAKIIRSNDDKVVTSREVRPEPLIAAMVMTFVLGLVAITVLLGVMKSVLGLELGQILAFATLSFLIMLSLEGVFLLLLFRRNQAGDKRTKKELAPAHTTKELAEPQVHALPEPLSSVTDHTTRAFEPIYSERPKAT